jgi:hypothetical protein
MNGGRVVISDLRGPYVRPTRMGKRLMSHLSSSVRQHDTHEELVGRAGPQTLPFSAQKLNAIIVPASRPAVNLDHAITLARAARCQLVILCSHEARPVDIEQLLCARSFDRAIVINVPSEYTHPLFDFSTSRFAQSDLPAACAYYKTDLSTKRNIGLLLARMMGWQRVFFLDDDIRDINYSSLCSTVSMLGPHYSAAGMRVFRFPDNSVVCHAHRMTGEFQDVFISGSALAVDCIARIDFFPDIYNEDWLFFYNQAAKGRLASSGLNVTQLCYNPFAEPRRAAWQEFGDVLAEGLYSLLHRRAGAEHASRDYWAHFITARRNFLEAIISRSDRAHPKIRYNMLASVEEALICLTEIQPEICERYVRLLIDDQVSWQQSLKWIRGVGSFGEALKKLELSSSVQNDRFGEIEGDVPENKPPGPVLIPYNLPFSSSWEGSPTLACPDTITARMGDTVPLPRIPTPRPSAASSQAGRGRHRAQGNPRPRIRGLRPMDASGSGYIHETEEMSRRQAE